ETALPGRPKKSPGASVRAALAVVFAALCPPRVVPCAVTPTTLTAVNPKNAPKATTAVAAIRGLSRATKARGAAGGMVRGWGTRGRDARWPLAGVVRARRAGRMGGCTCGIVGGLHERFLRMGSA